jgi:hypothetical protein
MKLEALYHEAARPSTPYQATRLLGEGGAENGLQKQVLSCQVICRYLEMRKSLSVTRGVS